MNFIEASIFILFIAILSVPLANRLRLPLEIFLVLGSCVVSMMPGLPSYNIDPVIVFNIFLPPILFYAAFKTSWRDFKFNFRPIALLSFGLVLFTTIAVAALVKLMLPGFTWAEGFLLGAIVSPTDASAATTILKKLGAPRRFVTILEGESLVNDATALTLYRFSLAAILTDTFSPSEALGQFFMITLGGIVVGLLVGFFTVYLLKRIKDVNAETTFSMIAAFTSYLLAEHLGYSGVISTVVAGLFFGIRMPELLATNTRVNAKASWNTLMFVINGFVFTLIGFQLPTVLKNLGSYSIWSLFLYGAIVSFAVVMLRVIWIYPSAYFPRLLLPRIKEKDPMPPWQFLFALGWTGMRGIVSLAAVLAIPAPIISGVSFPHRDLLIFLTYCVIVTSLIVPTLTLPSLMRFLNLKEEHDKIREEAAIRIRMINDTITSLEELKTKEYIPAVVYDEFTKQIRRRLNVIQTQLADAPFSMLGDNYFAYKKLMLAALSAEKITLLQLRNSGEIHDAVFQSLLEELDIEEIRAKSYRI